GYWIPGEEHKRELDFGSYSTLEDGTQHLTVRWDSLGLMPLAAELPGQMVIHKVETARIERKEEGEEPKLVIYLTVHGFAHANDRYYEVSAGQRVRFGAAYFGLAALLIGMLWLTAAIPMPDLTS